MVFLNSFREQRLSIVEPKFSISSWQLETDIKN